MYVFVIHIKFIHQLHLFSTVLGSVKNECSTAIFKISKLYFLIYSYSYEIVSICLANKFINLKASILYSIFLKISSMFSKL